MPTYVMYDVYLHVIFHLASEFKAQTLTLNAAAKHSRMLRQHKVQQSRPSAQGGQTAGCGREKDRKKPALSGGFKTGADRQVPVRPQRCSGIVAAAGADPPRRACSSISESEKDRFWRLAEATQAEHGATATAVAAGARFDTFASRGFWGPWQPS